MNPSRKLILDGHNGGIKGIFSQCPFNSIDSARPWLAITCLVALIRGDGEEPPPSCECESKLATAALRTKMDPYSLVGDSSSLFGRNFKSKGVLESHCDGLWIYALTVLVALHQHQEKYRQRGLGILFLFSRSPVGVHGNFFILMYRHQNS